MTAGGDARASAGTGRLVEGVRRRWRARIALRGLAAGVAAAAGAVVLLLAADGLVGLPAGARGVLRWAPLLLFLAPPGAAFARAVRGVGAARLGLLVDERAGLGNLFSTLQTSTVGGPVGAAFRERAAGALVGVDPGAVVPLGAGRPALAAAGAALAAALALLLAGGAGAVAARWVALDAGVERGARAGTGPGERRGGAAPSLGPMRVSVRPPAYTRLASSTLDAGQALAALPGSVVEVEGAGTPGSAPSADVVGGPTLTPRVGDGGWSLRWPVAAGHRGLDVALRDGGTVVDRRVIPLHPLRDRPPTVALTSPAEDMVLATGTGTVAIRAVAEDDYGVAGLTLRWVRSRGSGESFDFEEGTWAWDRQAASGEGRSGDLALDLAPLGLLPGDVLHVRATATDANDVTGPGVGASATRQIRIAREDGLDEVTTLVGFPIEREREPLLSQRMIILLTEELLEEAPRLDGDALRARAADIAGEQARLRGRMGEQIFSRATGAMQDPEAHLDFEEGEPRAFLDDLEAQVRQGPLIDPETGAATISQVEIEAHEHDSDPIVAINRALLTVYNLMWNAEGELRQAALRASLPHQRLALEELQRLREGERVFARGRVAVAPVDVPAARGQGELDGAAPGPRAPAPARPDAAAGVLARLDELLAGEGVAVGRAAAIEMSGLALDLLPVGGAAVEEAGDGLARAAARAEAGDAGGVREALLLARRSLVAKGGRTGSPSPGAPRSLAGARYGRRSRSASEPARPPSGSAAPSEPFVFATARYASGDWDSAPLVPANLIHSLAQYTAVDVAPEGVVVDLAGPEALEHPFLYLTGHLPVFFDPAESRNLVAFVERGGLLFIDDHNHDIDGAFHRSVTAELERLFGAGSLRPVPKDHELYHAFFAFDDGPPITSHELSGWGDGLIHRELFQVEAAGRIGVLYSNKDYSSEWSYHADNKRFLAVDNTRFGVNLLVYALTR